MHVSAQHVSVVALIFQDTFRCFCVRTSALCVCCHGFWECDKGISYPTFHFLYILWGSCTSANTLKTPRHAPRLSKKAWYSVQARTYAHIRWALSQGPPKRMPNVHTSQENKIGTLLRYIYIPLPCVLGPLTLPCISVRTVLRGSDVVQDLFHPPQNPKPGTLNPKS